MCGYPRSPSTEIRLSQGLRTRVGGWGDICGPVSRGSSQPHKWHQLPNTPVVSWTDLPRLFPLSGPVPGTELRRRLIVIPVDTYRFLQTYPHHRRCGGFVGPGVVVGKRHNDIRGVTGTPTLMEKDTGKLQTTFSPSKSRPSLHWWLFGRGSRHRRPLFWVQTTPLTPDLKTREAQGEGEGEEQTKREGSEHEKKRKERT